MNKSKELEYKFSVSTEQLKDFLNYIKDIVSINDEVSLKIDNNYILMYSSVGENTNINAFKSIIVETEKLFNFNVKEEFNINYIISNGKKFERIFKNFLDYDLDLDCKFLMSDEDYSYNLLIRNNKLKLNFIGGDPRSNKLSINVDQIKSTLDIKNSNYNFILEKEVFNKIKKMSLVELDNDILTLKIIDKKLSIGENTWELNVCDIDESDINLNFPKKYFNSLNFMNNSEIKIYIFDNFIYINNENTDLLVALELSI